MEDPEVRKALREAVRADDAKTLTALIKADKARLNWNLIFGTVLHIAASEGNLGLVQLLLELGADLDIDSGIAKSTPLHLASSEGKIDVVKFLLSRGAKLELAAPEKNPLFAAIHGGHSEIAKLLIEHGIDTRVKYKGTSGKIKDALSYAHDWGQEEIAELIEQANAAGDLSPSKAKRKPAAPPPFTQELLLETATREGIEAFRAAVEKYPEEKFYAFVFYVDNDITSVYPHANTVEQYEQLETSDDPTYFKWAPAEWPLDFGQYGDSEFMRETSALLNSKQDGADSPSDFGELKRQTLATLAQALLEIRKSGIFKGHADVKRLACWPHVGDACGEEEWMFEPVIKHLPADIVKELRALFEFKAKR